MRLRETKSASDTIGIGPICRTALDTAPEGRCPARAFEASAAQAETLVKAALNPGIDSFALQPGTLYVGRVSVVPEFRRRGVASRMMRFIEAHAPSLGRDSVSLKARGALPSNVELYRSLGYEVLVERAHPRGDDRELLMVKRLR